MLLREHQVEHFWRIAADSCEGKARAEGAARRDTFPPSPSGYPSATVHLS